MKKTIKPFSARAAMMLLATLLLTLTAQTAWAETVTLTSETGAVTLNNGDVLAGTGGAAEGLKEYVRNYTLH